MANKTARLGDLATYINGYAFKPADWGDTGLPIIRIQDLNGNSYQLNRYDGEYPERIEVNDGDVLISWSASLVARHYLTSTFSKWFLTSFPSTKNTLYLRWSTSWPRWNQRRMVQQ